MDQTFAIPYASQGLSVVALDAYDSDALDVPGLEDYISYLDVSYKLGIETTSTYEALSAIYEGSNPYPLDIVVGRDGTIRYIGREYDAPTLLTVIEAALAETP
ncbi:MAG TPA: hypothetical protein PKA64_11365 [Myxococcota bacterium]|nr:hypothetical protein [Myxococcota bacterium]